MTTAPDDPCRAIANNSSHVSANTVRQCSGEVGYRPSQTTKPSENALDEYFERIEKEAQLDDFRNAVEKLLEEILILDAETDSRQPQQRSDADDDPGEPE
jgi:hypothetical protein